MDYNIDKIKHALEQSTWSEVKRYLLDKLLELKNETPKGDLPSEEYKIVDLSTKRAYQKLHEILSQLAEWSKEDIKKTKEDREKDSFSSIPQ